LSEGELLMVKKYDISRIRQGISAIIASILFFIVGYRIRLGFIAVAILEMKEEGIIDPVLAQVILQAIFFISFLSGVLVLIGGILHLLKRRRFVANTLISFGSGSSIFNLILFMITTGPLVKLILLRKVVVNAVEIGFEYVLVTLASIFAYIAIISDLIGFTVAFIAGFLTNLSSSIMELIVLIRFLEFIGIRKPPPLIMNVLKLLMLSGALMFFTALFYGTKWYKAGYWVAIIGMIFFIFSYVIILLGIIKGATSFLQFFFATIGLFTGVSSVIYGKIKIHTK